MPGLVLRSGPGRLSSWSRPPTHGGTGHVLRAKERVSQPSIGILQVCALGCIQKQSQVEKTSRVLGGIYLKCWEG